MLPDANKQLPQADGFRAHILQQHGSLGQQGPGAHSSAFSAEGQ